MATLKQRTAATKVVENMLQGNPRNMKQIMLDSGYEPSTARIPQQLMRNKGFQESLLELLNRDEMLRQLNVLMTQDRDLRVKLGALVEGFKLTDSYPASKLKSISVIEERNRLSED